MRVTSNRHGSLLWVDPAWRQLCSLHLNRDFQAMFDREDSGEAARRTLLRFSKRLFRWWRRLRERAIERQKVQSMAAQQPREVKVALGGARDAVAPRWL